MLNTIFVVVDIEKSDVRMKISKIHQCENTNLVSLEYVMFVKHALFPGGQVLTAPDAA